MRRAAAIAAVLLLAAGVVVFLGADGDAVCRPAGGYAQHAAAGIGACATVWCALPSCDGTVVATV